MFKDNNDKKKKFPSLRMKSGRDAEAAVLSLKLVNLNSRFPPSQFPIALKCSPSWTVTLSTSDDNHLISTSHSRTTGFTLGKDSFSLLRSQEPISFPNQLKRKNRRAQHNPGKRKLFWLMAPAQVTQPHVAPGMKSSRLRNVIRGQDHTGKIHKQGYHAHHPTPNDLSRFGKYQCWQTQSVGVSVSPTQSGACTAQIQEIIPTVHQQYLASLTASLSHNKCRLLLVFCPIILLEKHVKDCFVFL